MKNKTKPQNYHDYLKLESLLSCQELVSDEIGERAHDEMLFIITHQVYELWFKQILFELDSIFKVFDRAKIDESHIGVVVGRLERINEIQQLLIDQIKILETMTPMDFLNFRDLLTPASGFQSAQFRLIENKFGLKNINRHGYGGVDYKSKIDKRETELVQESEQSLSLFDLIEQWLERTPFLVFDEFDFWDQYRVAVQRMITKDKNIIKVNEKLPKDEKDNYLKQYKSTEKMFMSFFDDTVQ